MLCAADLPILGLVAAATTVACACPPPPVAAPGLAHAPAPSPAPSADPAPASELDPWAAAAEANLVELEGATYADFAARVEESAVPATATDIWATWVAFIDGHRLFVRFQADPAAVIAACGALCVDANAVTTLPDLWPSRDEVGAPPWLDPATLTAATPAEPVAPTAPTREAAKAATAATTGKAARTWLTLEVTPYTSTGVNGEPLPCGYSRARGRLLRLEPTGRASLVDFSIQWYRTGCGG
jgi:hypothetical protein